MLIKVKEFKAIAGAMDYFMKQGDRFWNSLTDEQYEKIVAGFEAMRSIIARHEEQNAKTAQYIATKRKDDKNYARSKKSKEA